MTASEQVEKAEKRYYERVRKAQCHTDLLNAAEEYITALRNILERLAEKEVK